MIVIRGSAGYSGLVYGMEPLRRRGIGSYKTADDLYAIIRRGRNLWVLLSMGFLVEVCDTKLSCECVLARLRALRAGTIDAATYKSEIEPWISKR